VEWPKSPRVLVEFFCAGALSAIVLNQVGGDTFQWNHFVGVALRNSSAGHAADYAGVFALRDGHATGSFERTEAFGAVFTHAGHQEADGGGAKLLSDGMKENVGRWAVTVDGRAVG